MGIVLLSGFNLAYAQNQTQIIKDPIIPINQFTKEPPPLAQPGTVLIPATKPTQQSGTVADTTPTNTQPCSRTDKNCNPGGSIIVNSTMETPVLTPIDASPSETQEHPRCEISNPVCPGTIETIKTIDDNQIQIAGILILGSLIGFALWFLALRQSANSAQIRDRLKSTRKLKAFGRAKQKDQLIDSYNKIGTALAAITYNIDQKTNPGRSDLKTLKNSLLDLELFASVETRTAAKKIQNLLSREKAPSLQELNSAKKHLIQSIKKDLEL